MVDRTADSSGAVTPGQGSLRLPDQRPGEMDDGTDRANGASSGLPWGVIVLALLALAQALVFGLVGLMLIAVRDSDEIRTSLEVDTTTVMLVGVVMAALGAIGVVMAVLLARRSQAARSVYAAIASVEAAAAVYTLIAVRDIRAGSLWSLAFSTGVIWLLYGSARTEEFFNR